MKKIEEKINAGRSYRNTHAFEVRDLNDGQEDKKTVRGYATTFNDPYVLREFDGWNGYHYTIREQVDAHAFDDCDMSDVIFQYDHEGRVFARNSNGTLRFVADAHGLLIEADLGGTQIGRDLYEEIRGGYTNKMSFGFTISEQTREETEDTENKTVEILRTITKIGKLYDVSAVSLPANDATEISARNFCDGVINEIEEEFREKERRAKQRKKIKILSEV